MGLASYGKPKVNLDQILMNSDNLWKLNPKFFVKNTFEHRYSEYFKNKYKNIRKMLKDTVSHKNFAEVSKDVVKFIKKH